MSELELVTIEELIKMKITSELEKKMQGLVASQTPPFERINSKRIYFQTDQFPNGFR